MGADRRNDVLSVDKTVSRGSEISERRRRNICDQHTHQSRRPKTHIFSRCFSVGIFDRELI